MIIYRPKYALFSLKIRNRLQSTKQPIKRNHKQMNNSTNDSAPSLPKLPQTIADKQSDQSIHSVKKELLQSDLVISKKASCSRNQRQHPLQGHFSYRNDDKKQKMKQMINRSIYHINSKTQQKLNDIKRNEEIALQDNFDLKEYQDGLFKFVGSNWCLDTYRCLRDNFQGINDILNSKRGKVKQNNKWKRINLNIRPFAPQFLLDKFKFMNGKVY